MIRTTQKYRNSTLIKNKQKNYCIGLVSADTQNVRYQIGSEKQYCFRIFFLFVLFFSLKAEALFFCLIY